MGTYHQDLLMHFDLAFQMKRQYFLKYWIQRNDLGPKSSKDRVLFMSCSEIFSSHEHVTITAKGPYKIYMLNICVSKHMFHTCLTYV